MFEKILIANRGEIACRVIRACRKLGVAAAAVYSRQEGSPLHAELADDAIALPDAPSPVAGYLNVGATLDAARRAGAQAVHPGYGFLSESAALAEACADAGIAFVGPSADAIRAMADKRAARRRAAAANVPVLSGADVPADDADIDALAARVGYPLMVKASGGGGGIGMQLVESPRRLRNAVRRARSAARRSFGNDAVYLERFVPDARHVEAQVIGDDNGIIHLWERECSAQRRRQKVIEEAPSPSISAETRERLIASALDLARDVGYVNAGTFEYVADSEGGFYFLEANTRLQVEHGVTEMITGVDIVEQQLRVAAGMGLSTRAAPIDGHAIECRVYAEHPRSFIPSPGALSEFVTPAMDGVRVDSGYRAGDEVSTHFDPLLAKIIARGDTREAALALMSDALAETRVSGVETNIPTLRLALRHPDFVRGRYTTDLLALLDWNGAG